MCSDIRIDLSWRPTRSVLRKRIVFASRLAARLGLHVSDCGVIRRWLLRAPNSGARTSCVSMCVNTCTCMCTLIRPLSSLRLCSGPRHRHSDCQIFSLLATKVVCLVRSHWAHAASSARCGWSSILASRSGALDQVLFSIPPGRAWAVRHVVAPARHDDHVRSDGAAEHGRHGVPESQEGSLGAGIRAPPTSELSKHLRDPVESNKWGRLRAQLHTHTLLSFIIFSCRHLLCRRSSRSLTLTIS